MLYKHKYLQRDNFDNNYITKQFEELDLKMGREGRPTVLPLNKREARIYIKTGVCGGQGQIHLNYWFCSSATISVIESDVPS